MPFFVCYSNFYLSVKNRINIIGVWSLILVTSVQTSFSSNSSEWSLSILNRSCYFQRRERPKRDNQEVHSIDKTL